MVQIPLVLGTLALAWAIYKVLTTGRRASNLPPGPPTLPLLGNLHLMPQEFLFLKFTEWAKEFGEIYSIKAANETFIVLNTPEAVREILEKNQATTADRPPMHITAAASEDLNIAFMTSEIPLWAKQRKAIRGVLTQTAVDNHLGTQIAETSQMMHDLLEHPTGAYDHIARSTVSGQLNMFYGIRSTKYEGSEAETFFKVIDLFNQAADPTSNPPVDMFPILKYVPERWASWKALCRKSVDIRRKFYFDRLLNPLEEKTKRGEGTGSFMETFIQTLPSLGMTRHELGHMGAALMEGSSETTTTTLKNFVAAMISYPQYQERAHEEMDRVVGHDRFPELADIPNLKYMNAIIDEVIRMRPPFPSGVPHVAAQDEVYKGYVIPKGSIIFMNIWGIGRNQYEFEEPELFNPERFLKTEFGTKPGDREPYYHRANIAFGAGRRICPGEILAKRTVSLNIMHMLWGFHFKANAGSSIPGTLPFDLDNYARPGIVPVPKHFTCDVTVRGEERAELIRTLYAREWGSD